jgi:hypothetical protein
MKPWRLVRRAAAIALCAAGCGHAAPPPAPPAPPPEATYVFSGRVVAGESSTLPQLPAERGTWRVAVERVHYQEGTFTDQTGREITVTSADNLQPGGEYLFYTDPFLFGTSLAVRAVRATREPANHFLTPDVGDRQRLAREQTLLGDRVVEAELIVVGTVVRVEPSEPRPQRISEHDPDLRRATVRVERALAGAAPGAEVTFMFAASRDVHWYRAPKPAQGDAGIFLLNTDDALASAGGPARFTLLHPLDLQPRVREAALRPLLRLRR